MPRRDSRWRRLVRRLSFATREEARLRRDINDEIDAHLTERVAYLIARGATPEAARAEALRRFGNVEAARVAIHADAVRQYRRVRLADRADMLRQDIRYVVRTLLHRPAFASGVVLTFALGLGINAAIFRVADVVLFRAPAVVRDAGAIREIDIRVTGAQALRLTTVSWMDAERIRASGAFDEMSAGTTPRAITAADGRPIAVAYVDDAYFTLLGVPMAAGRAFHADEGRPGAQVAVAVVSFTFWKRQLGGGAIAALPPLKLNGKPYAVVGVAAPDFTGIDLDPADVWLPLGIAELGRAWVNGVTIPWYQTDMARPLRVVGRPAVADEAAESRLTTVLTPAESRGIAPARTIGVRPIVPVGRGASAEAANRVVVRLLAVAALVLLIAVANATNLLLARSVGRQPELAIRAALGAGRGRLFALLLVESTVLAAAGGAAAALGGVWTSEALRRLLFPDGRWTSGGFDTRTLFFVGGLALAAGLAAGLAPALQATGLDLHGTLKEGRSRGGRGARRARAGLLVTQTALALTLLVASGLLIASLLRLNDTRLGFDPPGLVSMTVEPAAGPLQQDTDPSLHAAFVNAVRSSPGVRSLAFASIAPFGATSRSSFTVPGSTFTPESRDDMPLDMRVSPEFFAVLGTRIVWGRPFSPDDVTTGAPVSVVNESMAKAYWGLPLPAGACVLVYGQSCALVVGIVEDTRESPAAVAPMRFYLPFYPSRPGRVVLARTPARDAHALADRARASVPPGYRATIEVVSDRLDVALRPWRMAAWLFVAIGAVALALACGGIHSVMTYATAERRHEIGVRLALGASRNDVLLLVIRDGLRLAAAGAAIGVAVAALTGHLLGSLLFGVSPFNPAVYAASLAAVLLAALAATSLPAGRAARLEAAIALRQD